MDGKLKKLSLYPNIYHYLISRYNDSTSINETLLRIKYGIEKHPLCPICGKPTIFLFKYKKPFTIYCSQECANISDNKKEKFKQTCLQKFGVETPLASKKLRNNGKITSLLKYGTEYPFQSKIVQEKYRETCKNKYGCDWNSKTDNWKKKMSDIMSSDKEQEKRYKTLKEHHTFNYSTQEEKLYLYIKAKFHDGCRQYKCKRYPFYCDFYIPSLDLFIEYNGHQSHGEHPYNKDNINDINKVEEWKQKYDNGKHPMYLAMINTWTIRDVNKRNIAKQNHLNYKEIWNLEEGKKFIDSINF